MLASRTMYIRRLIRLRAVRKGLLGGDRFWLSVFIASMLGRRINRWLGRGELRLRFSEKLEPGESLVISHLLPPPKRRRR